MTGKVTSLADAVARHVRPGDVVHAAYADARPNAALHELVRRFAGDGAAGGDGADLTIVTAGLVSSQHALVETGVVTRAVLSFAGENLPSPRPNKAFQRAVREGRVTVENWSLWSLTARLMAGALGVPRFPVRSLGGSGMGDALRASGAYTETVDPVTGEVAGFVSALRPDVVLVQGIAADAAGNVVISAPNGENQWGALAARRGVIACVERIVDDADVREHNALVRIPAHTVLAVVEAPYGSHPYGLFNPGFPGVDGYVPDEAFIADVLRASTAPETFADWIREWLTGTADHDAYLAKLGPDRLAALIAHDDHAPAPTRAEPARDAAGAADVGAPADRWTPVEAMIVTAARRIESRVRAAGHDAVLAGVGHANLASWLAVSRLKDDGVAAELMAEIGMFGYRPRPGEPFIFAHHNLPTCSMLTDVATVLGAFVGGPATRSLGVIGAGQIDAAGSTNSTYGSDGTYLVGSGGANDIASAADDVLVTVTHDSARLVAEVPYVTAPGRHVRTVVTSAAVLERAAADEPFTVTAVLAADGETTDAAVARVRAGCGWELAVAPGVAREPLPTAAELAALRAFDPARVFLGRLSDAAAAVAVPQQQSTNVRAGGGDAVVRAG